MARQEGQQQPARLVILARGNGGEIIVRMQAVTRPTLLGAMATARSILRLKKGAIRVEIHLNEQVERGELEKPLVVFAVNDLSSDELEKREHS